MNYLEEKADILEKREGILEKIIEVYDEIMQMPEKSEWTDLDEILFDRRITKINSLKYKLQEIANNELKEDVLHG